MTVEELLKQLESDFIANHEAADNYEEMREYHYKLGNYRTGVWYDLQRAKSLDEAIRMRKIINEIEKRVS